MPKEEFTLPPNENGEYARLMDPPSPEEAVKFIASTIKSERQTMKDPSYTMRNFYGKQ